MESFTWPSLIAGILVFAGFFPYIYSILQYRSRPHFVTWFLWTILGALSAASYAASGAPGPTLIVPVIYVFGPLLTALLAYRYGDLGYNRFDLSCFFAGLSGILLWLLTDNPKLTLYLLLLIDFFGALPTLKKVAFDPHSENLPAWSLFAIGGAVNLLTIPAGSLSENFVIAAYPIYLFFITSLVTLLSLRKYF